MIVSHASAGPVAASAWRVPFVCPDLPETESIEPLMAEAMASGVLTKGPHLRRLEEAVAALSGSRHAIGMSSCTVGLAILMRCLAHLQGIPAGIREPGTGERSEVILPSFMFLAGPAAATWAGFEPVFVDVDPHTWTLLPEAVEAALSPRTFAILGCHTFGVPCDIAGLTAVARRAGVPLVFDAAHGLGSSIGGRQVGSEGLAQVFSLSPTKLVVAGEGGIVTTGDASLAERLREGREYGNDGHYGCTVPGLNGRMPEACAILAAASLERLAVVAGRRAEAAVAYRSVLERVPGVGLQQVPHGAATSWKDFTVLIDAGRYGMTRDAVRTRLASEGIDTRAYYAPACHEMEAFRRFHAGRPPLPTTKRLSEACLSLPMGRHVTPDVARGIAEIIARSHHRS